MKGVGRTAAAAVVLVALVLVALHTGTGRTPPAAPTEATETLGVDVEMALVPDRPEACQLNVLTHHGGDVTTGGGVAPAGRHQEYRATVGGRFEVLVAGRPCTADPMVVTARDPGALVVEVAVANSGPRLLPDRRVEPIGGAGRAEGADGDGR